MQSVKLVVRRIGVPNKDLNVYSAEETSEYLEYQYPDFELKETHYLGEVKDLKGSAFGWTILFVLVRAGLPTVGQVLADLELKETPARKLGRPAKGS